MPSFSLAGSRPADVVLSRDGSRIYASGPGGVLRVYSAKTGALVESWPIGIELGAIDISPDGSFLIVVEGEPLTTGGQYDPRTVTVYQVDTATGAATDHPFQTSGFGDVFFDVAILSDGTVLLNESARGSGLIATQRLDPVTGEYSAGPAIQNWSILTPAENGSSVLIAENTSNGPLTIYDDGIGLGPSTSVSGFNWGVDAYHAAAGRVAQYNYNDGINIFDAALVLTANLGPAHPEWNFGAVTDLAFDRAGQSLLVLDNEADAVVQLDAADWSIVQSVAVGFGVGSWSGVAGIGQTYSNRLLADPGSRYFSVVTDSRLVLVANPAAPLVTGSADADLLEGTLFADRINGAAGDDRIEAGDGADRIDGGAGADMLVGGGGDDLYLLDNEGDRVVEAAGQGTDTVYSAVSHALQADVDDLFLTGAAAIDGAGNGLANRLTGNAAANRLDGLAGNDTLDGGAGADRMAGGPGDDVYILDSSDQAIELVSAGTDTVRAAFTATLAANLENLTLTGDAAIDGSGNELANLLNGNGAANVLRGNLGSDTLDGGAGADTLIGGAGNDVYLLGIGDAIVEQAGGGTDTVLSSFSAALAAEVENLTLTGIAAAGATGNALANTLTGNGNSNRIDGGAGADAMAGGLGHDTYVVDHAGDTVTEAANAGADTVQSVVTFTLGANVENLTLTGVGVINGTGNALANGLAGNGNSNRLDGGAGADSMAGGLGHDTYVVDQALDNVTEATNAGSDAVISSVTFTLGSNIENLTLTGAGVINGTGNALANSLTGNGNSNRLDGGAGADTMTGGLGHDVYVVDNVGDKVTEAANAGADRVESSVSFTLGANVENLVLTGAAAANGTGNALANALTGNGAANVLRGGAGNDIVSGGAGADSFQFDTPLGTANIDHIADFAHGTDRILLENAVFAGLAAGALPASAFATGTTATSASHRILYDAATGALRFDADGSSGGAAILFAILDTHPASLAASDFVVI
jgi:Ca2+-binding RTX toxin-like protein